MKGFFGGTHLEDRKQKTERQPIRKALIPKRIILPLQQNLGCPNEPLVKVGDEVIEGQKIADTSKFVSAPVHASIFGKIIKIEKFPNPCGFDVDSIVIEAAEKVESREWKAMPATRLSSSKSGRQVESRNLENLRPEDIRRIVREAGIVGLGGAAFPTHVKLSPPAGKKIDAVIINGCECEPYITSDHRVMLERAEDVLYGAEVIAKAVGASRIIVGVENNKRDAIEALTRWREASPPLPEGEGKSVEVIALKTKYPQGGEKMLIKSILNREVPSGGLPMDVGVVVHNVGTAVAIAEAVKFNKPLIERVVTVTGSGVREPQNLLVRIGTTFAEAIEQCGGITDNAVKVIMGGPMTGVAVSSLEFPIVKATNCILVLNRRDAKVFEEEDCIRCGRCIKACPTGLMPNFIADYAKLKEWIKTEEYHVADCIECGCCSYVCPSRIFLVQYFKIAKKELMIRKSLDSASTSSASLGIGKRCANE